MYNPETAVHEHCPPVPVTATAASAVVAAFPVVVKGIPTYNVDAVQENVPATPVIATDANVVVS
jgi:hypothetical protein